MVRIVKSVWALALIVGLAGMAQAGERLITVTGQGRITTEPDLATILLGVTHDDRSAQKAMDRVSADVARILARLGAEGIAARDLQTRRVELHPLYSSRSSSSSNGPEITGFSASNTVMVRVRDLPRLGQILNTVLEVGANQFQGLSFGVADTAPLAEAARRAAVADGIARATLLAEAAGVALGPVQTISDQSGTPRPMMMEAAAARSGAVPVAAGEVTIEASVNLVFAIGE